MTKIGITFVAGMMCLASVARGQAKMCIIDGAHHPAADCSKGGRAVLGGSIGSVEVWVGGPSAVAKYGPGAENGVIIITTKMEGAPSLADDPLARFLFPPELVMSHQQEIGLTDRQRSAIQAAMKEAQAKFIDLQFAMSGEVEKLQGLIKVTAPDEAKVLEQVDRVLASEREVKHAQLALMIRIKNQLTDDQQATLSKLRSPLLRVRELPDPNGSEW